MIISAASDYRAAAQRILPPFLFHYIDGGAYAEYTLRRNVEDLSEVALRQRVLKNMSDLTKGKEKYVPSNGVILAASTVEFRDGESVFDVLKRACDATGIQLEYAYSPGYGTNYIEGINNLYEFDCGSQSGWIYKVNGWSPNYGASGYKLKGGESIVWEYTCKGLGSDAGGTN